METATTFFDFLKNSEEFRPQIVHERVFAETPVHHGKISRPWSAPMETLLAGMGRPRFYSHQAEAIDAVREGRHIIVATPTASGKSLIYQLPVLDHLLCEPAANALYLFPLKALAQDQLRALNGMLKHLPDNVFLDAAIYDGDTSAYKRRKIRENPPAILISNPDILHLSLLGYHQSWAAFWTNLSHVVIDEVHTYRGIFGSHMAWVLRRLKRICAFYGSRPVFVLASATVGNPQEIGEQLLGEPVEAITRSGAPAGKKIFCFVEPFHSAAHAASLLLEDAVKRELRSIVYTQSRKMTELVAMWTAGRLEELGHKLASYRAGFLPEDRRDIEAKLASAELYGVVSTSALELGIDIGELEVCILVGYPGSIMATWQRGGRVGRRHHDSLIILIAHEDALDRHFMRNPDDFFGREVEKAILNPHNEVIMRQHLICATAECSLDRDEELLKDEAVLSAVFKMQDDGDLLQGADGRQWFTNRKYPHREVDLRGTGDNYLIRQQTDGTPLGEVDGYRCFRECHPGAVYLHMGKTWLVDELDLHKKEALVSQKRVGYFTRALAEKDTEILEQAGHQSLRNFSVSYGRLKVTDQVTGYQKRLVKGQRLIGTVRLDLPPHVFKTEGLWLHIPAEVQRDMEREKLHFMGGIHALEHAAIGMFPLLVLCDRNDIGGISIPFHPQIGGAAVFIYDGYAGGMGLCRQAYDKIEELLLRTREVIRACSCEVGCPSCVHSPKCGSGNRPIDKAAALILLDHLLGVRHGQGAASSRSIPAAPKDVEIHPQPPAIELPEPFCVFDVETKRSAAEVGGWHRSRLMGVSTAVVYDSGLNDCITYREHEMDKMIEHLRRAKLVVGFNSKRFDYQVLSAYTRFPLHKLPSCDILEVVANQLGYRLSLDKLAANTLGHQKSADGLQALQWYKEGNFEALAAYCRKDVEITRDLFLFGMNNGYLLFTNKAGNMVRCPFKPRFAA